MKSLIATLALTLLTLQAQAGISSGGGSDRPRSEDGIARDSAWFVGTRSVKACLQVAPGYGIPVDELAKDVEQAFAKWNQYLNTRALTNSTQHIASKIEVSTSCSGTEDLTVYFAATNNDVVKAKAKYVDPAGMAELLESRDGDFGRGFLWIDQISPDYWIADRKGVIVQGLLLHEMGHAFGNQHTDGTIMDRQIAAKLLQSFVPARETLERSESIDQDRELISCLQCRSSYEELALTSADSIEVFADLTGRAPVSEVEVKFLVGPGFDVDHGMTTDMSGFNIVPKSQLQLQLRDSAGTFTLPVTPRLVNTASEGFELGHVFSVFKPLPGGGEQYNLGAAPEMKIAAQVQDSHKRNLDLTITVNGAQGYFSAQIILQNHDGFKSADLMTSGPLFDYGDRDQVHPLFKTCSADALEPYVKAQIVQNMKAIDQDLIESSVSIQRQNGSTFYGAPFLNYTVNGKDKRGTSLRMVTFVSNRAGNKFGKQIGGVFVSAAAASEGSEISVGTCDSEYLSFASLFTNDSSVYATRLVDGQGKVVGGKQANLFDSSLRAASVPMAEQ